MHFLGLLPAKMKSIYLGLLQAGQAGFTLAPGLTCVAPYKMPRLNSCMRGLTDLYTYHASNERAATGESRVEYWAI